MPIMLAHAHGFAGALLIVLGAGFVILVFALAFSESKTASKKD